MMLGELRKLLRETAIYGLSTVLARLLNILLLPLYTHALSRAEYGVVGLVFSYIGLLNVIFGHGMDLAYMRHQQDGDGRVVFSTAFWSLVASSLGLAALLYAAARGLAAAAGLRPEHADLVRYAAWILAFDALSLLPFAALRLSHRAGVYAGLKSANIVMNFILNYVFLVRLRMGVQGVFLATLITSCASLAMLAPVVVSELDAVFDRELASRLARFALPLVPAGLASMAVGLIDRPILKLLLRDDAAIGVYQANYRLGIFMQLIVLMFDQAWRPFFIQNGTRPDGPLLLARVMTYFAAGAAFVFLAISLFIPHLVALPLLGGKPLIHPDYWVGLGVVPLITLAYLCNGLYVNLLAPLTLAKRTDRIALATAVGAAVNIAANFALIPVAGLLGAGLAALLAYAAMALTLYRLGRPLFPVPYEGARLLRVAAAAAAVLAGAALLGLRMNPDRPLPRLALLAGYPLLLALSGFLNAEERQRLRLWAGG